MIYDELVRAGKRLRATAAVDDDFPLIMEEFDCALGRAYDFAYSRPRIVCLCGSTRFWEAFRDWGLKLTLEGKIVLSIGIHAPDSMTFAHADSEEGKRIKADLDVLHKRKIDLADEVVILNVGGYIGESTRSELEYAKGKSKLITFLEPISV